MRSRRILSALNPRVSDVSKIYFFFRYSKFHRYVDVLCSDLRLARVFAGSGCISLAFHSVSECDSLQIGRPFQQRYTPNVVNRKPKGDFSVGFSVGFCDRNRRLWVEFSIAQTDRNQKPTSVFRSFSSLSPMPKRLHIYTARLALTVGGSRSGPFRLLLRATRPRDYPISFRSNFFLFFVSGVAPLRQKKMSILILG